MVAYYLILMMAVADRIRGDAFQPWVVEANHRLSAYIILGWTFSVLSGHPFDWFTIPVVVLLVAGASSGLSEPIGAYLTDRPMDISQLEWWQFGWLKQNALLALIFRGGMWGFPVSLLGYFDHQLFLALPAYTIAMPAAAVISKYLFNADWARMEFIRGGLAGGLFVGLVTLSH
jgi:hypothetical protein